MATEMTRSNSSESALSSQQSLEQERDCYKEKVDHMKLLLKQCQTELHTYKIRHGGVETFSRLLQETKQENSSLNKKLKTLETIVRNLQSRLINHGLSASLSLEESDDFIPGTSKQVLENLTRENSRLKQLLRTSPSDPEEIQTLQQVLCFWLLIGGLYEPIAVFFKKKSCVSLENIDMFFFVLAKIIILLQSTILNKKLH